MTTEIPVPETFKGAIDNVNDLLHLITIRANTLIHETGTRLQMSEDKAAEWDYSLALYTNPMTYAYFHRFILSNYLEFCEKFKGDQATKTVFERMAIIFAQTVILEDAEFYRDFLTRDHITEIKSNIMDQMKLLREDVVSLTYLFSFRDKMLGPIGANDMNPYQRFISKVDTAPE